VNHEHPEAVEYSAAAPDLQRAAAAVFKSGDRVKYVPHHAHGDAQHPDCEIGDVEKVTEAGVFVRFTHPHVRHWPQCCDPETLVHTL
jgi:hypothetical protein